MAVYRRKEDSNVWHWCTNCSQYPSGSNIITRHTQPEYGERCRECQMKEQSGDCKSDSFFSVRK
ncbi:hypothetical protein [Desulfoglaeba alkanexedens]|jgi:hypothetical protein|uniref:Uncharacterized protein n=1 Tax=Desulfoglaeba alkanexedens ALDC TaxID=980445 RepID=A0A4P8L5J8_9BACT|nr:hypothetical protein [Desulfoglaeba alkanexedens]QCQ23317.1 hypothetical protein FDQ92_14740 [Desulfoglaeba alkanexedens ALDC]